MKTKLIAAVVAAAIIAGGAVFAYTRFSAPAHDDAITLVPSRAVMYANVFLSPSTSQKRALEDLLEKFDAAPTPDEAKEMIEDLIDEALEGSGLTYGEDIEPWLGPQAAFFVADFDRLVPETAALIATTDEDATRDMMEKADLANGSEPEEQEYEGVSYDLYPDEQLASGFVEGFWIVGTESGFKAVVDTHAAGESLAGVERYEAITARLTDDPIGLFYADFATFFEAMERVAGAAGMTSEERAAFDAIGMSDMGPAAAALSLTKEAAVIESASSFSEEGPLAGVVGEQGAVLPELPGESWIALGIGDLGDALETILDLLVDVAPPGEDPGFVEEQFTAETGLDLRSDLLSWMGDAGLFVQGTGFLDLGGGLVLKTTDEEAAERALDKLAALALREGAAIRPDEVEGAPGYALQEQGMPEAVYAVVGDERVVVAYGRKAISDALSQENSLADAPGFGRARDALGDGFSPAFYLDFDTVQRLAENMGARGDETYRKDVAPWLEPLTHMVAGSKLDGGLVLQRFLIGAE